MLLSAIAIAFFLFGLFLVALKETTNSKFVRKDILMSVLVALFLTEACFVVAGVIPNIVGLTIILVVGGLVVAKRKIPKFNAWLETKV
jgi:uncharacterized membrane protein